MTPSTLLPPGQVTLRLRKLAEDVVLAFFGALRITRYHKVDNEAVLQALRHLRDLLGDLFNLQVDVSILYYASDFYVNEVRLRTTPAVLDAFTTFAGLLKERHIGGIRFIVPPNLNSLARLVALLTEAGPGGAPFQVDAIGRALAQAGVPGIELTPFLGEDIEDLPEVDPIAFVHQAYFQAIRVARDVHERARARRPVPIKYVARVVQAFVDTALADAPAGRLLLTLLTQIKNWGGYLANHAVNTSVLAVAFGRELGLDRALLRELGTAAFLADVGNALTPEQDLASPGPLRGEQRKAMTEHPLRGLVCIAPGQRLDRLVVEAALGSALHHRHPEGGGYPRGLPMPRGLFHHVIAVCDRYDALTTARPFRKAPLPPAAALAEISAAAGSTLHPVVAEAFALWIRSLPPARVVVSRAGEVGVRATGQRMA